jgi:glycerate 2-kinase
MTGAGAPGRARGKGMIIKNRDELLSHGHVEGRRQVLDILEAGMAAGDPYDNVCKALRIEGGKLIIGSDEFPLGPMLGHDMSRPRPFAPGPLVLDLDEIGDIYLVGGGKAAQRQAEAIEDILGDLITDGHVNAKKGDQIRLKRVGVTLAGHPNPDEDSVIGARRIVEIERRAKKGDIVFMSESGGGTALLTLPAPGLTLEDIQETNRILYLEHGAPMPVANAVRFLLMTLRQKHSRHVGDATLIMFSTDERPPSNPVSLEPPHAKLDEYDYAISLLHEYGCWDEIPESVRRFLLRKDPAYGKLRTEDWYDKPHFRIRVMGPEYMLQAAECKARALGLDTAILCSALSSLESRVVGASMVDIAREIELYNRPLAAPAVFVIGGELVVTTGKNPGEGGRNTEFVVSAACRIVGSRRIVVGSADSDGSDGPTDYAGGIVDGETVGRAAALGLDVETELRRHNTCGLLRRLGDAIDTGVLHTNVQDLRVMYVGPQEK